jgi:hypothetical protein
VPSPGLQPEEAAPVGARGSSRCHIQERSPELRDLGDPRRSTQCPIRVPNRRSARNRAKTRVILGNQRGVGASARVPACADAGLDADQGANRPDLSVLGVRERAWNSYPWLRAEFSPGRWRPAGWVSLVCSSLQFRGAHRRSGGETVIAGRKCPGAVDGRGWGRPWPPAREDRPAGWVWRWPAAISACQPLRVLFACGRWLNG